MEVKANDAFDVYRELYVGSHAADAQFFSILACLCRTADQLLDIVLTSLPIRYYEGGISSVYLWDMDNGFAGCVLLKKCESLVALTG
jgi:hypothetical protein